MTSLVVCDAETVGTVKKRKRCFACVDVLANVGTAKFEECEKNVPKLSEFNQLNASASPYSSHQFLSMELRVLQFFQWNISLPTAAHFFEYFLIDSVAASDYFEGRRLGSQAAAAVSTVSKYVVYFLEISLQGQK